MVSIHLQNAGQPKLVGKKPCTSVMSEELGGGASKSTDPAAGTSSATDVSLRDFINEKFIALEKRFDERRVADQKAVELAKETADAALETHTQLIRQMRAQAIESQRQLDKLTDTYATKENLQTLEVLIDQRLKNVEAILTEGSARRTAVRGAYSDLRGIILLGFTVMAGVIGLMVYLAQN